MPRYLFVRLTIQANCPLLTAFANGAKAEVGLINAVQVSCYADTRILKTFPQILKVLYNEDVVSDQAIIYWHQKGAKPNGKQHFLKMTEAMVKVCNLVQHGSMRKEWNGTEMRALDGPEADEIVP